MSMEENKAIVRRYFDERWNHGGNIAVCDELFAPAGIEDAKAFQQWFQASFSNIQLTTLDILGDHDQLAIHWKLTATHQGEYLGVAATGKPVTNQGISLLRVKNGKIVEDVAYWNDLDILKQLGVDPTSH